MPLEKKKKEHKCSHHATSAIDSPSWWQKFHFSGKVIMCSVLFGLGLVLIGGLVLAIGAGRHDEEDNGNLNEVQNKAPMSIVGPIIMGIGSFTVLVGIIMCLFETNICRKRQPDSRPLIEEQSAEAASRNAGSVPIPSTTHKREKHRHHKKSSPRKHKTVKKPEQNSNPSSPSSMPINVHRSLSKDLTASDKFLTPPSSLVYEHPKPQPVYSNAENQTSASLMKSFMSSEKSWNTSTEFQTPSSSLQDHSGSFEGRSETSGISPETKELSNDRLANLTHEFVTPQNSNAEIVDDQSSTSQEASLANSQQENTDGDIRAKEVILEKIEKTDALIHDFVTPINSYVEQPNVSSPKLDASKENYSQTVTKTDADNLVQKSSKETSPANSLDSLNQKNGAKEETTGVDEQENRTTTKTDADNLVQKSSNETSPANPLDPSNQNNGAKEETTGVGEQEKRTLSNKSSFTNTKDSETNESIPQDTKETEALDQTLTSKDTINNIAS